MVAPVVVAAAAKAATAVITDPNVNKTAQVAIERAADVIGKDTVKDTLRDVAVIADKRSAEVSQATIEEVHKTADFGRAAVTETAKTAKEAATKAAEAATVVAVASTQDDSEHKMDNTGNSSTSLLASTGQWLAAPGIGIIRAVSQATRAADDIIVDADKASSNRAIANNNRFNENRIAELKKGIATWNDEKRQEWRDEEEIADRQRKIESAKQEIKDLQDSDSGQKPQRRYAKGGAETMLQFITGGDDTPIDTALSIAITILLLIVVVGGAAWLFGMVNGVTLLLGVLALLALGAAKYERDTEK